MSYKDYNENYEKQTKYYTIYSCRLAKALLKWGCTIADVDFNTQRKGVVFHFINEPKLRKMVALQSDISELQDKFKDIALDDKTLGDSVKEIAQDYKLNETENSEIETK